MEQNVRPNNERRPACMLGNYYCMSHVIRQGDTLYRLSREYGVKVSALMMANPFVDIYNLRIGDELCIPRLRADQEIPPRTMMENMQPRHRMEEMQSSPMMENMGMCHGLNEVHSSIMTESSYDENERVVNAEIRDRMEQKME